MEDNSIRFVAALAGGKSVSIGDEEMWIKLVVPTNQIPDALAVIGLLNRAFTVVFTPLE